MSSSITSSEEKRDNIDVLGLSILNLYILSKQLGRFVEFYRLHFKEMQRDISAVGSLIKLDELRWRSNWFYLMGYMLE